MMDNSNTQVGGKNRRNGGGGRGRGGGRGGVRGNGGGRSDGKRGGQQRNGCEDVSPCINMKALLSGGPGGKGATVADSVPPAHATAVMEENLRVAHTTQAWLKAAASSIDVKMLERSQKTATPCTPRNAVRVVNEVLLAQKSLMASMNDIVVQIREMAAMLHVDATSFRDGLNKPIDPATDARLSRLLIDGNLYFGGTSLKAVLSIQNQEFRDLIFQKHGARADPLFMRLDYGSENHTFSILYNTDLGVFEIVFYIGVDGRAVQPQVDRPGAVVHEISLLSEQEAEELARQDAAVMAVRSSEKRMSSTTRLRGY